MSHDDSPNLKRQIIPLLRAAYWAAAEAPKSPADDLMLELCDELLTRSPAQARDFFANPLATPPEKMNPISIMAREDAHAFFRVYRLRATWLSLEERSPRRLRSGLFSFALCEQEPVDWRDLLISLAPYHHCARVLGVDIPELFDSIAPYAPPMAAPHFGEFARRETSMQAFGWIEVQTPYGPRLRQRALGL